MTPDRFNHLPTLVGPLIAKKPCRSRNTITEAERLMVTLRYLATGEAQQTQAFYFRLGKATVSKIVRETCQALWEALNKTYVKTPSTTNDWKNIAKEFNEEWNFPHCLGAIDGKHIMIECPENGGPKHNWTLSSASGYMPQVLALNSSKFLIHNFFKTRIL